MTSSLPLRTAFRLATREMAASRGRFLFIVFAVAVGVGSLAGVRGFGRSFRTMLLAEARTLMAADLLVRVFDAPTRAQIAAMDAVVARGARRTHITETFSVTAAGSYGPALVAVKAVDPSVYPFYGTIQLEPPQSLASALAGATCAVSNDLLLRLHLSVGDQLRVGAADLRIAAIVTLEPDRMTGSLNVGPRVMISRETLERTDLIKPGSRASHRHLFRLDPQRLSISDARAELRKIFPDTLIADYRQTHPQITRGLDRSERFLSLVSLIALIVGAIGVAATMHAHLRQRLDSIAIMKCLGARSSQILRVYLLQTLFVGAAGGLLGCVVGGLVQAAFPLLIAKYFSLTPRFQWDFVASIEALSVGVLTALLFTLPALLGIRDIRPAVIFRRDMTQSGGSWRRRWLNPAPWISAVSILAALAGIAAYFASAGGNEAAARTGGYFTGGLVVSLLALAAVAWLLLRVLRSFLGATRLRLPTSLRHGIANIYRPGNQAQAVLVALGIGVMFTLTVLLIQRGMLSQMLASAPPNMPNVFLLNITSREREPVEKFLLSQPFTGGKPEIFAVVGASLQSIDGRQIEKPAPREGPERDRDRGRRRDMTRQRAVTFRKYTRPQEQILQGRWWDPVPPPGSPNQVCVEDRTARELGIAPGAQLDWKVGGQNLQAAVACVFITEEVRFDGSTEFVFSPNALGNYPVQYFAALRMRPSDVAAFQRASFEQFPSVTVINAADVIEILQQVVDQIALVVRFISLFAILAGVIILASSVAATRFRRIKEVAILKTLGASRRRVATIFSIEFLILGAVAGVLGSLLASGFSNLLMVRLLDGKARLDWAPNLAAVVLTAVLAVAAGWLAGHRILSRKPLEVLRHE